MTYDLCFDMHKVSSMHHHSERANIVVRWIEIQPQEMFSAKFYESTRASVIHFLSGS